MHRVARVPLLFCFRVGFGLHGAFSNRLLKPFVSRISEVPYWNRKICVHAPGNL